MMYNNFKAVFQMFIFTCIRAIEHNIQYLCKRANVTEWMMQSTNDVTIIINDVTEAILTININTVIYCIFVVAAAFILSCFISYCWQRIEKFYHIGGPTDILLRTDYHELGRIKNCGGGEEENCREEAEEEDKGHTLLWGNKLLYRGRKSLGIPKNC